MDPFLSVTLTAHPAAEMHPTAVSEEADSLGLQLRPPHQADHDTVLLCSIRLLRVRAYLGLRVQGLSGLGCLLTCHFVFDKGYS